MTNRRTTSTAMIIANKITVLAMLFARRVVMKRVLPTVVVLTLVLPVTPRAQGKPDFSGTWTMDQSRSESANQGEPIGPVTVVISQTESELRIETTRLQSKTTAVYKLDGSESRIAGGTATTHWDGTTLVIEAVLDVQGAAVTTRETRRLGAGGNEMLVETVVLVQHGYSFPSNYHGAGRNVFVKARP
jgi:hypothetical protein